MRAWWMKTSAASLIGVAALGYTAGRIAPMPAAQAADSKPAPLPGNEPGKRIVAYLHNGKVPITREDLGEYLIARMPPDRVELLVNKVIIETACREKGVEITAAEVDAAFQQDLAGIAVNRQQFIENVLKQYGKSEFEWKEDVIRPRLQLSKLCRLDIKVTDDEIQKEFDAEFGLKVEGRIIVWPKGEEKIAFKVWEEVRNSDDKFEEAARQQPVAGLAATGGRIKPFGRGSGTHPALEAEAFKLKEKQISTLIATNEGLVCFKLDRVIQPDERVKLDDVRERLSKAVYEKKLSLEIPKQFKKLRDAANPVILMKKTERAEDLERNTQKLLQIGATSPAKK